jgi:hypothetical protein
MKEEQELKKLNAKWDLHKVVQNAVNAAHINPSPETRERLTILETNNKNIMDKMEEFQIQNKESHQQIIEAVNKLESKLDCAIEKKAGKWVEKVIWGVIIFLMTGVFGYIGSVIIRTIETTK